MTGRPVIKLPNNAGALYIPSVPKNRGRLIGIVARDELHLDGDTANHAAMRAIVDAFTVNLTWEEAEPVRGGTLQLDKLSKYSDFAVANGYPRFRVRIFAGDKAPYWAKVLDNFTPMQWKGADGYGRTVGPFWKQSHRDAYYEFTQRLAVEIDARFPLVAEVTDATMTTIYAENYLRGWAAMNDAELRAVVAAGYSYQEDEEANFEAQDRQYPLWSSIGVSVLHTYNPWQRMWLDIGTDTIKKRIDMPWTLDNVAGWQNKGRFAVTFNTSLGSPVTIRNPDEGSTNYQQLWEHMNDGWPTGIQTMTMNKMKTKYLDPGNTPYQTVELAASLGFIDVEISQGTQYDADPNYRITPEQADVLNAALAANAREGQVP